MAKIRFIFDETHTVYVRRETVIEVGDDELDDIELDDFAWDHEEQEYDQLEPVTFTVSDGVILQTEFEDYDPDWERLDA